MKYEIRPCTDEDEKLIEEKLDEIDDSIVPPEEGAREEYLVYKVTDAEGNIIGGCIVEIESWKIAVLDILWVDEKYRRMGLGSALISEAEKAARERGCYAMGLGTFSFQARPLYEKHGYKVRGTFRDYPRGHENYTLLKRLDQPIEEYVPSKDLSAEYKISAGNREDAEFIGNSLREYNSSQAHREHQYIPLNKKLVDEDGKMIAAIFAGAGTWNQFEVEMIWVDEEYRNQSIGTKLLADTEREAKELGAYTSAMGVHDWMSGFFEKNGYEVVGTLDDFPKGHSLRLLQKKL